MYGTSGPIYGVGGAEITGNHGYYYRVTWLSDANYQGMALVRGQKLNGSERIVFAGPLASGNLVTTDTLVGTPTKFYG